MTGRCTGGQHHAPTSGGACPCGAVSRHPAAPESLQERIADVLAGWPVGNGYYSLGVDSGTAREMAIAVLSEMRQGAR